MDLTITAKLGLILLAALAGGTIFRLLRLPALVGYLMAGIIIGPAGLKLIVSDESVTLVSELGVLLLMFAIGAQISIKEILKRGNRLLILSLFITGFSFLLGWLLSYFYQWNLQAGIMLGLTVLVSSTVVGLRILEHRGELSSSHGITILGVLLVQDLVVVLSVAIFTISNKANSINHGQGNIYLPLIIASVFFVFVLVLATRLAPYLLNFITRTGSRELFVLSVVVLGIGTAYISEHAGFSREFGAFLAGLVIAESDFAHEAFSQVRPLRDVFAALFFVSIGLFFSYDSIQSSWNVVVSLLVIIIIGKGLLTFVLCLLFKVHHKNAILTSVVLANIGEFSFVIIVIAYENQVITLDQRTAIITAAISSMMLTPLLYRLIQKYYPIIVSKFGKTIKFDELSGKTTEGKHSVLIVGGGRVGRYVSDSLIEKNISHIMIDYDISTVVRRRKKGVPVIFGDAVSTVVLSRALDNSTGLAIVALPEYETTLMTVREIRRLKPKIKIVARVHRGNDILTIKNNGADAVVHAEFEAGAEMIRQTLERLSFDEHDVEQYIESVRKEKYRHEEVLDENL